MSKRTSADVPTLAEIDANLDAIAPYVLETPVIDWPGQRLPRLLADDYDVVVKLEALQRGGSFKPRGAVTNILSLSKSERELGVTAISAGNHAIAVAYAAQILGVSAKVVMASSASPVRVALCEEFDAEVVLADSIHQAFETVAQIQEEEGRYLVHPFEGAKTILGTATLGVEFARQAGSLDAVIIPVGGGGLIAGPAIGIKSVLPTCKVYGVEPTGAQGMTQSLAQGAPMAHVEVTSIADSLGAPMHTQGTFELVRDHVDDIVLIEDDDMRRAMELIFYDLKMAVEPAGAASTAALIGPLHDRLQNQRVGLITCGANIDVAGYQAQLSALSA